MNDANMPWGGHETAAEASVSHHAERSLPAAGHIDIVSDAICPWCWIGKRQFALALDRLAEEGLHFTQSWRPYQLNPDMPVLGVARAAYRARKFGNAERARQMDAQVASAGRGAGLEVRFDRMLRRPSTIEAHRLIRLAGEAGQQDAVVEALFAAYFNAGRDIGMIPVLAAVAREAGLDEAIVERFETSNAGHEEVLAEDAALRGAGLSGVPSFVLDRHLLFSGALPAEEMAAQIGRAVRILRQRQGA